MKKKKNVEEIDSTLANLDKGLGSKIFDIFNVCFLCFIALSCILPVWYTLCVSLSEKAYADAGLVGLWPMGFNLNSYEQIVVDKLFWGAFLTSVKRVLLGTSITLTTIILMAYPLSKSKKEFAPRNIIMWIIVFCMLFNGGTIPWFIFMKNYGLINSIWALVFAGGLPIFNVILMMNFIRNIPSDMEEAAQIDGAGPWSTLLKIVIPISKPVIATITLFTAIYHWNEFFNGLVLMNKTSDYPLQTYIQQLIVKIDASTMSAEQLQKMSEMSNQTLNAAKLFVAIIPVMIVYPFLQKYFINGIMLGSVKE